MSQIQNTQPTKQKNVPKSKDHPQFEKWELVTLLAVTGALILFIVIFWGIFLKYYQEFIGSSLATLASQMTGTLKTILTIVQVVIGWPLILFILALDVFLLYISYRKSKRGIFIIWGLMIVFLLAGIGLSSGFRSAQNERMALENSQQTEQAALHFNLGVQALQSGNLELANLQFNYVLEIDSNFPGLVEKMVQVQEQINFRLTPTITPTPTLAPTPDTRSQDEIYSQVLDNRNNQDWTSMFSNLEALRNIDPEYKALELDGLYYLALRQLGVQMIVGDYQRNIQGGHLEEGIYYLNLAEKYGPIDNQANQYRSWARNYINALAYWDVNWERVVSLLQVVASALPNLTDSNNITAATYYVHSLIRYADQYTYDPCTAYTMYQTALDTNYQYNRLSPDEIANLQTNINDNYLKCYPPTPIPTPTVPATPTLSSPTETPTGT